MLYLSDNNQTDNINQFFHMLEFCQFWYILGPYCNQHVHDRTKLHISRVRFDALL